MKQDAKAWTKPQDTRQRYHDRQRSPSPFSVVTQDKKHQDRETQDKHDTRHTKTHPPKQTMILLPPSLKDYKNKRPK